MNDKIHNVLFLCTGNSARSILAEGLMNFLGSGRFQAYSAGSFPLGRVNPLAIETLLGRGIDVSGMRSKSWDEYAVDGAPHMDFIFTVCDAAAGEACPVWPGPPATAHWGASRILLTSKATTRRGARPSPPRPTTSRGASKRFWTCRSSIWTARPCSRD